MCLKKDTVLVVLRVLLIRVSKSHIMKNIKIGQRLALSFLIILSFFVFIGVFATLQINKLTSFTDEMYAKPFRLNDAVMKVDDNIVRIQLAMKDIVLNNDTSEFRDTTIANTEVVIKRYEEYVYRDYEIIKSTLSDKQSLYVKSIKLFNEWKGLQSEVVDLAKSHDKESAYALIYDKEAVAKTTLDKSLTALYLAAQEMGDQLNNKASETRLKVLISMALVISLAIIISIFLTIYITRSITKPLAKAVEFAKKIESGDLSAEVDIDQKDELGDFAQSLRTMLTKINSVVLGVKNGVDTIVSASQELNQNSDVISSGVLSQTATTEEVSASVEEMAANIEQTSDNSEDANEITSKMNVGVKQGSDAVNETTEAMSLIASKINIIRDIASRTNILAINAAIEASRAGEHGKGFAVVASEVRMLAERSQVSAKEITDLTLSSVSLAEKSADLLNQLVPDIEKASELVSEITVASKEQSLGAGHINIAINQLSNVALKNSQSAGNLTMSSRELLKQSEHLNELIDYFTVCDECIEDLETEIESESDEE